MQHIILKCSSVLYTSVKQCNSTFNSVIFCENNIKIMYCLLTHIIYNLRLILGSLLNSTLIRTNLLTQ